MSADTSTDEVARNRWETTAKFRDHLFDVDDIDDAAGTVGDDDLADEPVESLCGQQSYGPFERVDETPTDDHICGNCVRIAQQRNALDSGDTDA